MRLGAFELLLIGLSAVVLTLLAAWLRDELVRWWINRQRDKPPR